jgi:hypothetical protein
LKHEVRWFIHQVYTLPHQHNTSTRENVSHRASQVAPAIVLAVRCLVPREIGLSPNAIRSLAPIKAFRRPRRKTNALAFALIA